MDERIRKLAAQVEKLSWMLEHEVTNFSEFYEEEYGFADGRTPAEDVDMHLEYLSSQYALRAT